MCSDSPPQGLELSDGRRFSKETGRTMETINVIRGRLTSPTTVELYEPAPPQAHDAEVWLRVRQSVVQPTGNDVFDFLRKLPPGNLTKDELDTHIRAERDEWEGR